MVDEGGRSYKLLVVDDEPEMEPMFRQRLRRDIRQGRYEFFFAGSGIEALELLEREPDVALMITDLNMPGMDGLTLLGQLAGRSVDLRSVVFSAYSDMKNVRAAMGLGAVDFVIKPVDFEDMRETIERHLRGLEEWRDVVADRERLDSLRRELDLAGRIQRSVLSADLPEVEGYEVHALLHSAKEVSGDFYDVMLFEDGRVGLVVGDVSGKGIPAALLMMASRTLLRGLAVGLGDPARVLSEANALLSKDNSQSMFVTAFLCIFDPGSGQAVYANAGHPSPFLVRGDGTVLSLESAGDMVLGLLPGVGYASFSFSLEPGGLLFVYTDGVTEAVNHSLEEFGKARLAELLSGQGSRTASECADRVLGAVREFAGVEEQFDDITCLLLRRGP